MPRLVNARQSQRVLDFLDPELGLNHIRPITGLPLTVQVDDNGACRLGNQLLKQHPAFNL
jgi:hypothetical protein